ncbi:uncharacterized protein AruCF_4197 [Achromobacter ruhlandii]|nr:uncharacterized protein AruCF_4197 [Achromobacter ruhlandii]
MWARERRNAGRGLARRETEADTTRMVPNGARRLNKKILNPPARSDESGKNPGENPGNPRVRVSVPVFEILLMAGAGRGPYDFVLRPASQHSGSSPDPGAE